jgi:spore coat polysaccharide biosynthesis protein SpsF
MSRVVAVIQARMGSTRLPQKVLTDIVGKPMLWHVINRLKKAKFIDEIIVATSEKEEDELIINLAQENGVKGFAGSEEDVLDRYFQAAKNYKADVIVRITADCPLIDPDVVDKVIKYFLENDYDYVSNTDDMGGRKARKPTYPDGLDTEVFSFAVLERTWKEAKMLSEREHVTSYIWKHPKIFKISSIKCDENLSNMRWTVDRKEDLMFVRAVYKKLYRTDTIFNMNDILSLLKTHPELMNINRGITRNEGYRKSLEKDKET